MSILIFDQLHTYKENEIFSTIQKIRSEPELSKNKKN